MRVENNNRADSGWQWSTVLTDRIPSAWLERTGWVVASSSDGADPVELLDAHTRQFLADQRPAGQALRRPAQDADELTVLTHLAGQVAYTVRPVAPAPHFRKELRQALLATHRQQAARRRLFAHPLFEKGVLDRSLLERLEINSPLFWQISAAVPVLIVVAALIWRFARRSAPPAEKLAA